MGESFRSTLVAKLKEAVPNGTYSVRWRIVGKDGHPIEGGLKFDIRIPVKESPTPAKNNSHLQSQSLLPDLFLFPTRCMIVIQTRQ
ncbi:copper resistance protein CopC [Paenibacillus agaridevorans]|uniref:copper resistance CopC family protein n=1 Tax=Paenibacillus agaridevorans TaxID=171404 RepID=UPI001BE49834